MDKSIYEPTIIMMLAGISYMSYILLTWEIEKYGNKATTQKAHMTTLWAPMWGLVYLAALPTAIIVRCIYGKKRH